MLKTGTNNSEIDNFAPISLPPTNRTYFIRMYEKSDSARDEKVRLFLRQCGGISSCR